MTRLGKWFDLRLRRLVEGVPAPVECSPRRTRIDLVELSKAVPSLSVEGWTHAQLVVTLHGQPLGEVRVDLPHDSLSAVELSSLIHTQLCEPIRAHLRRDGIESVDALHATGSAKPCLMEVLAPTPPPLVSVIVPTRDRTSDLEACLKSMTNLRYPNFEVIVVDNAPADDLTEALVRHMHDSDPRIRYVREVRPGASLARNIGAGEARGELLAFTDDDAEVDPLWLTALVAGFRSGSDVACVSGLTLPNALETPAQQAFEVYGGMGLGFTPRLYDLDEHRGDALLYPYTAGVFGASNNVAFDAEDFRARGGFDVTIGPGTPAFGAEDLDLFLKVIMSGRQISYEPSAMVRHAHRAEYSDLYWQVFTYSAGLTALLTKWALQDRRVALDLARRVPRVLPAALWRPQRSGPEAGVGEYSRELRWLERAGYLYGPLAFVRSRLAARRWW